MHRRSTWALGIFSVLIAALLLLQTPLLRQTRALVWRGWVAAIARLANLPPLTLEDSLQQQLEQLRAENIRLQAEQHDYYMLREQLGTPSFASLRAIPALVATQPVDTFHTRFIVQRGAKDGVTLGAPVVTAGSVLLGFITDLNEHSAVCQLLLHPATNVPSEVAGEPYSRGLVTGRTYTSLIMKTIPRDAALAPDQKVITLAEENVPAGLLVGTIQEIRNEQNEAYQEATIALPYSPDDLRAVTILVAP